MECVGIPLVLMVMAAIFWFGVQQGHKHKDALKALADQHPGLRVVGGDEVRGEVKGVEVQVDTYTTGSGKSRTTWTRFRLSDPTSLHARSIGAEGLFSGMGKLLSGEDVQLGDPAADGKLLLRGSEVEILSHMNAHARFIVTGAVTRGWEHEAGTWRFRRRGKMTSPQEMSAILARGFETTTCLRRDGDRLAALVDRAIDDPLESARVRAIEVRLASGPLSSTDEERLVAQGGTVAVAVAQRMGVRGIPALRDALQRAAGETRLRAALALAKLGEGDVAIQSTLLSALSTELYQPLCIAALEKVGTVDAVPLLAPIAESWVGPNRHAAKKAIRAIQSRLSGAGVGQLSVAESTGGGLGVAEAGPGEAERQEAARKASSRQGEGS